MIDAAGSELTEEPCLVCRTTFPTPVGSGRRVCWACAPTVPAARWTERAYLAGKEAAARAAWQAVLVVKADELGAMAEELEDDARGCRARSRERGQPGDAVANFLTVARLNSEEACALRDEEFQLRAWAAEP